jgi:hypothetical protein
MLRLSAALLCTILAATPLLAQTRDEKVRSDRQSVLDQGYWVYNDLAKGRELARQQDKPLLVVLRCIPCEHCQRFDAQFVQREETVSRLLDKFICVRIVKGNDLDLDQFQMDFDMSFGVFFLNADGTIYGRYGTRSSRGEAEYDISFAGLKKAMEGALELHSRYPLNKAALAGKRKNLMGVSRPEEYERLARYQPALDYQGEVAKSCLHCHQIRDAERRLARESGEPLPDILLYPYPKPDVLGLVLDIEERATIKSVTPDSAGERGGFRAGDEIVALAGQPILSIADVQWVMHTAPEPKDQPTVIPAQVRRDGKLVDLPLALAPGWRKASDISWRTSSWELRRMAGGMKSDDLSDDERKSGGLDTGSLALLVKHVGQFGEHQNAKRAGIRNNDLIVAFNGRTERLSEAELLAYVVQECKPGQKVPVKLRRGDQMVEVELTLQ